MAKSKSVSNSRHIPDPNKFFRNVCKTTRKIDLNSLLYSRWKPAATTLMSLWKCSRSRFEVELRRAGAVVPAKDGDNQATWGASEDLQVQKHGKVFFFFPSKQIKFKF